MSRYRQDAVDETVESLVQAYRENDLDTENYNVNLVRSKVSLPQDTAELSNKSISPPWKIQPVYEDCDSSYEDVSATPIGNISDWTNGNKDGDTTDFFPSQPFDTSQELPVNFLGQGNEALRGPDMIEKSRSLDDDDDDDDNNDDDDDDDKEQRDEILVATNPSLEGNGALPDDTKLGMGTKQLHFDEANDQISAFFATSGLHEEGEFISANLNDGKDKEHRILLNEEKRPERKPIPAILKGDRDKDHFILIEEKKRPERESIPVRSNGDKDKERFFLLNVEERPERNGIVHNMVRSIELGAIEQVPVRPSSPGIPIFKKGYDTSVVSSVSSVSSFAVSSFAISGVDQDTSTITRVRRQPKEYKQLTLRPFFWRSHPGLTSTSVLPEIAT